MKILCWLPARLPAGGAPTRRLRLEAMGWLLLPVGALLAPTGAGAQSPAPAASYVLPASRLTLRAALIMAEQVRAAAATLHQQVSVAVVDAGGQTILLAQGDGVGPHNTEAARRKAFTALSTKTTTLQLGRRARRSPDTENLRSLPELLLLGGGRPLLYQGQVIGAVGVAGGGGPENDDELARAAALPEAGLSLP
ncbi:heme-binding protein [Hymenobacter tenuis]